MTHEAIFWIGALSCWSLSLLVMLVVQVQLGTPAERRMRRRVEQLEADPRRPPCLCALDHEET